MIDLTTARLPKPGSWVEATMEYGGPAIGELVGVIPGRPEAARKRDRWPKLALKRGDSSAAIPGYLLVKVRRAKRPKGGSRGR